MVILGGIILLLALVGFWVVAAGVFTIIEDWWYARKRKNAFDNETIRKETIKEAKWDVCNDIRQYCNISILSHARLTNNSADYCRGVEYGLNHVLKYVEYLNDEIKEIK